MAKTNGATQAKTRFVPTMKPLRARFQVNGSTLIVIARQGQRGFIVHASLRPTAKAKLETGARSVLQDEGRARAEFDRLKRDAVGKGWVEQVTAGANAFADIPAPPKTAAQRAGAH